MGNLRHRARAAALQALFEIDQTNHPIDDVIERISDTEGFNPDGQRFFARLVLGAWNHRDVIDEKLKEVAPSWPIHQLPGVDRAVLRIALFELLWDTAEDTAPVKAVINEAVELAKYYGSDSSSRFVNGVLSTIVNRPENLDT